MKHKPREQVRNKLADIRKRRGVSASVLARMVGVSRQTIYAIEGGTYIPNTVVGLRLAAALAVSVEDLFSLPTPPESQHTFENVTLLPSFDKLYPGQPVQLWDVDGRVMAARSAPPSWYLPASDGVIGGRTTASKAKVQLHEPDRNFRNRILLAGCDPAMTVVARYLQPAGIEVILLNENSFESLSLLKRGYIHVAGTHLRDERTGESNISAINRRFRADSVAAISFAMWEEGLVIANGNPKHIEGVEDLARRDIMFLNRESGSGSRFLVDKYLKRLRLDAKSIRGYNRTAPGHLAAAWEVKTGAADCCIGMQAAARVFGLDFISLQRSRYDLVMRKEHLKHPGIQALFEVINGLRFRQELNTVAGYETEVTGARIM